MIKRIIVIILALGLVSWGIVSCITSGNPNNGPVSYDPTLTAVAARVNAEAATATANAEVDAATANAEVDAATATANADAATATANADATQMALTPTPSEITVDLPTAVNQQLVTVSFTSTGGASGNVINITLHRFKSQNSIIYVTLPPGLLLTNSDPSEQNMILEDPPGTEMVLYYYDTTTSLPNALAFCVQLHSGNPTNGTSLTLSGQASSDLVSVMTAAAARNDSILVIQAAVWAITDNPTRNDLYQVGYGLSDQDLQSVRDLLRAAGLNPANYQLTA